MKAAAHNRYGPPDVVRVVDVPRPATCDDEVLVKVCATTVNRTDCAYRAAKPFLVRTISFEEAAPGTEGAHYALAFLSRARIRADQDVLVIGATGAIGSAAVQLLRSLGANVTAVCHAEYVALVARLGADRVINGDSEDFTATGDTYDVIIDAVGGSTFGSCRHLLRGRGIYSSTDPGPYWQNLPLALTTALVRRRRVVFPFPQQSAAIAARQKELMQSGDCTPVIDRRFPLDDIVEAYRYVESGRKVGNVVITVAEPA